MSKESQLEQWARLSPAGGHTDSRREIIDIPVGYLHGRPVAVSPLMTVYDNNNQPFGQHFHFNYGEVFCLAHGSGTLYLRGVVPGEKNKINPDIVVAQELPQYFDKDLMGVQTKFEVDSKDSHKKIVRVGPGLAHTFTLAPGSILIHYLIDTPQVFNPSDSSNFQRFPLI